jgi:tetratricopeptide (TPR) repeat protein
MGSVLWAKGDYQGARERYQQALVLVEMPKDSMIHARIYFGLGIADWFARDYPSARNNFERSIQIARDYGHDRLLPHALHNLGHIYKELGDLKKTIALFDEGYKLSKEYHDFFALTDSIVGFAEYYQEQREYQKIGPFAQEMRELENQGFAFPLFAGRMERILGEVAYLEGDLEMAKQLFSEGLAKIAEHGGYGKYELRRELLNLGNLIDQLPAPLALEWCEAIEHQWREKQITKGLDEMTAFVTAHKLMIKN